MKNMSIGTFGLIVVTPIASTMILFGLRKIRRAKESLLWPYVTGKITTANIITGNDDGTRVHTASVQYTYEVNGHSYCSSRISFGDSSKGFLWGNNSVYKREEIAQYFYRYPKNASVKVYYNPADPEMAVLEPGTNIGSYIFLIEGAIILSGAILGFFLL